MDPKLQAAVANAMNHVRGNLDPQVVALFEATWAAMAERGLLGESDIARIAEMGDVAVPELERSLPEMIAAEVSPAAAEGTEGDVRPWDEDPVDEASDESFPASDPPAYSSLGRVGGPKRRPGGSPD